MDNRRTPLRAAVTAITSLDSHTYRADIPISFCNGKVANGGFLTSLIQYVTQQYFETNLQKYNQPHTFGLHVVFLRPVAPGDILLKVQSIKSGSGVSVAQVSITQGGKERVVAYTMNVNIQSEKGVTHEIGYKLSPEPSVADLDMLASGTDGRWVGFTFPSHPKSLMMAAGCVCMFVPVAGPPRPNITDVWLTPTSSNDSFTTETLGFVADSWHRMPENILPHATWSNANLVTMSHQLAEGLIKETELGRDPPPHWYPTLTMSLDVKRLLPREGVRWLFIRAQAKEIRHGRMDVEVMIFDQGMVLVALSHQISFVVKNTEVLEQERPLPRGKL